jgi:Cu-Zn family superoxide dismutase
VKRPISLLFAIPVALAGAGIIAGVATAADPLPDQPKYSGTAVTTITGSLVDRDGIEIGAVQLSQDEKGIVQVRVNATNLKAGEHGIHIHATGKCEGPNFATANAHFNPDGKRHGLLSPDGHHNGDLPALTAAANGTAAWVANTSDISLTKGPSNIFDADGAALVIHEAADDHVTDATGNSGARIACAVIAPANPALATPAPSVAPRPPATGTGLESQSGISVAWMFAVLVAGLASGAVVLGIASRRS